jgi:hypothetical protein
MRDSVTPSQAVVPGAMGLRMGAIAWFLLAGGFLLALPVLTGLHVVLLPLLLAAAALLALLWLALRRIGRHDRPRPGLRAWLRTTAAALFVLGIAIAAPVYALALVPAFRPLLVPQATLTNGSKTLVFQGAVHIGSEPFYKAMVYDLERALSDGYVIYYEGVQDHPEGDAWFKETVTGGSDLNDGYKNLGESCGLKFQGEYFGALADSIRANPDRHVAADVNTLQLKQEYERLVASDPGFAQRVREAATAKKAEKAEGPDLLERLLVWAQDGNPRHHALAGVVCRGLIAIGLNANDKEPGALDPLILDFRNRQLIERLRADPRERILVNYGAGHLKGMLALLRQADPGWKVQEVRWKRALEAPEELRGPAIE